MPFKTDSIVPLLYILGGVLHVLMEYRHRCCIDRHVVLSPAVWRSWYSLWDGWVGRDADLTELQRVCGVSCCQHCSYYRYNLVFGILQNVLLNSAAHNAFSLILYEHCNTWSYTLLVRSTELYFHVRLCHEITFSNSELTLTRSQSQVSEQVSEKNPSISILQILCRD